MTGLGFERSSSSHWKVHLVCYEEKLAASPVWCDMSRGIREDCAHAVPASRGVGEMETLWL